MDDQDNQDDQGDAVMTIRRRLQDAGISAESVEEALAAGLVCVAGQVASDLETPAPMPVNISFKIPPASMMSRGVWR